MPDEPLLRAKARTAIQSGTLPRQAADSTFGGPGLGKPCAVCEIPILKEEMEIEVLFVNHGLTAPLATFHVHIRCFAAWEFERTKSATPGRGGGRMSETIDKHRVALLNSRSELNEALRVALEASGFSTTTAHLADIQDGTLDLVGFVHTHKPQLIVYDLPRPYERHWNFLKLLKETDSLKAATWVLTTTDKKALEGAVGASSVVEIIFGEPYGVPDVVEAVRKAFARRSSVY